ncbi:mevalonate kinase [Candidatus Roizmanbacteria bacterium]|jgi:mevalonate kinase|nr:mevalonate kinase [Candidatus Roizmanbacteria bacterium]
MKKVKVSAPGKLMIMGEHAVVYGHPCLVTAVDKRLYVEMELSNQLKDEIITPQVKESRFVLETIAYFKQKFNIKNNVRIVTKGDFSHQVGLGSSSAVTVATFKAMSLLFNLNLSPKEIFEMSYRVTLLIQGVGSGFDIAAATFGNTLYFVRGGKETENLPVKELPLIVGYSGVKADTPFYIRKVAEDFKNRRGDMERVFADIHRLVVDAKRAFFDDDLREAGILMTKNHALLKELGVSTDKLDRMVSAAVKAGAYGAKLSGAGGGDCMIALVNRLNREKVIEAIDKVGGEIINVNVNVEGVKVEKTL